MKISVCVPSYRRPRVRTFEYLPFVKIYIDGADEEEYRKYNSDYNLVVCEDGVQGNVSRVKNYILDKEFESGADAVAILDDDINYIGRLVVDENGYGYKNIKLTSDEVTEVLEVYSGLASEWGFGALSVNNTNMPMSYQHYRPFQTHALCVGGLIVHVKNELRYDESLFLKEDFDMFIQQQNKYRGMLGVRFLFYDKEMGNLLGGCSMQRNKDEEEKQRELLRKKWGSRIVKNRTRFKTLYKSVSQDIHIPIKGI